MGRTMGLACPSICPVWAPNWRTKIDVNVSQGRSNVAILVQKVKGQGH